MVGVCVIVVDFHLVRVGLAENREKQQLESSYGVLLDWNTKAEALPECADTCPTSWL